MNQKKKKKKQTNKQTNEQTTNEQTTKIEHGINLGVLSLSREIIALHEPKPTLPRSTVATTSEPQVEHVELRKSNDIIIEEEEAKGRPSVSKDRSTLTSIYLIDGVVTPDSSTRGATTSGLDDEFLFLN